MPAPRPDAARPRALRRLLAWPFWAPLLWTALILWASGAAWSADRTRARVFPLLSWLLPWAEPPALEAMHWLARRAGHATAYGVLAALWSRALGGWRRALALAVATGFVDELGQAATPTREGSAADVLLDSAGAALALALMRGGALTVRRLTIALLWLAAGGGTLMLALHLAADIPSRWLWLSTPTAWLALAWRRINRRARR